MKKEVLALVIIVFSLISIVSAYGLEFSKYDEIDLNLNISSSVSVVPTATDYVIKDIIMRFYLFPEENWQQQVLRMVGNPTFVKESDTLVFEWNNVKPQELTAIVESDIRTLNKAFPVRERVQFPIGTLTSEYSQWLAPTAKINSDDDQIIKKASSLVAGENDLFKAVFNLANFTKNHINYDLKYAGEVKSALWILNNPNGVCGDFSSLFMALCRAVGIPTKYVTGVAYSNVDNVNNFVPHAWVEVYFPEIGWIPFDPTYGEFGYIDPTHIKLKEYADVDTPSVKYEWSGKNYDVKINRILFAGQILNKRGAFADPFALEVSKENEAVGFGSYQLIKANVKNLKDYYIAEQFYLQGPPEIENIDAQVKSILLKPNEEKELYWIIRVKDSLSTNYMYKIPIVVTDIRDVNANVTFEAYSSAQMYSLSTIEDKISLSSEETEKTYSANVDFSCNSDSTEIFVGESADIKCQILNSGNDFLSDVYLCLSDECRTFDLGITQGREFWFHKVFNISADYLEATAKNAMITRSVKIPLKIWNYPKIEINSISVPTSVNFGDKYNMRFRLSVKSNSAPKEIYVYYNFNKYKVDDFRVEREVSISDIPALDLLEGKNDSPIIVTYKDAKGNSYSETYPVEINLNPLNPVQKVIVYLNHGFNWLFYQLKDIIFK
ncbi:MAG: transglutaminase-like domain-containing protein [Candidatus Woesearchaeota archaeon]